MANNGSRIPRIKKRMEKYLELDKDGVRHAIMRIILRVRTITSEKLHKLLQKNNYNISLKSVAAMLGTIASKLGILRIHKDTYKSTIVYTLKEEYAGLINTCLGKVHPKQTHSKIIV